MEWKLNDRVIDTMCVQDAILMLFIRGNVLSPIVLEFFSQLAENFDFFDFGQIVNLIFAAHGGSRHLDLVEKIENFFFENMAR